MNKIAELTDRGTLNIAGEDAENFLQNVVTSDVTGLTVGSATYAALLTPQGKLLFDFFVLKVPDGYVIDCALSQRPQLLQRLTMYKLRSKVTIETDEDAQVYAAWGGTKPDGATVYADPRTDAMGWRAIGALETNADAGDYHRHRIALGIGDTDLDIGSGEIFPHEGNLDQLGGVSFTKGCFVGQEVVSRMEHRGTARTRFVIATSNGVLAPEAEVKAGDLRIGAIKSVTGDHGLALIRLDRAGAAIAKGTPITVDGEPIGISVPDWARFDIPVEGHK
ncbi:MAG: folate-binding protein YgfZ [Rhizobiales bacterium]|nr:folate-binding protein YgfZ [Hyphomicrobiales bacterium]